MRALCRMQLQANLYDCTKDRYDRLQNPLCFVLGDSNGYGLFYREMPDWEIEELRCIRSFLEMRLADMPDQVRYNFRRCGLSSLLPPLDKEFEIDQAIKEIILLGLNLLYRILFESSTDRCGAMPERAQDSESWTHARYPEGTRISSQGWCDTVQYWSPCYSCCLDGPNPAMRKFYEGAGPADAQCAKAIWDMQRMSTWKIPWIEGDEGDELLAEMDYSSSYTHQILCLSSRPGNLLRGRDFPAA